MNVTQNRITYIFFLSVIFISVASVTKAQDMRGELKKQLRETIVQPDMRHLQKMYRPEQIDFQQSPEILKVSPTTVLPTRFKTLLSIYNLKYREVNVDLNVTNREVYKVVPAQTGGFDFDPVRTIQAYKARKRKEKVDKIVRVYSLD